MLFKAWATEEGSMISESSQDSAVFSHVLSSGHAYDNVQGPARLSEACPNVSLMYSAVLT